MRRVFFSKGCRVDIIVQDLNSKKSGSKHDFEHAIIDRMDCAACEAIQEFEKYRSELDNLRSMKRELSSQIAAIERRMHEIYSSLKNTMITPGCKEVR